ncbi:hypothetical protein ACJX0J_017105, partial [Zea mays]
MAITQDFAPLAVGAIVVGVLASLLSGAQSHGVCYGMTADDLPPPSEVVQLYKSNGIANMRVYSPVGE